MSSFDAIIFDLDNTLVDWDKAADIMFHMILKECYGVDTESIPNENKMIDRYKMLFKFKENANNGYSDKKLVLNALFDEYPPKVRIPEDKIYDFWNFNFPKCFSPCDETIEIIKKIKNSAKLAVISNGKPEVQKEKIKTAKLNTLFDIVIISDEVGVSKPDKRIFDLTLDKMGVPAEKALFVGDNIEKDVGGAQSANIKGVWFNPKRLQNETDIIPFAEIAHLKEILNLVPLKTLL